MTIVLVTGTSTEVGKTVATAALCAAAKAAGATVGVCKPAQTGVLPGEPGDIAEIARLSEPDRTLELVRYPEPLAPDTAARRAGKPLLRLDETISAIESFAAQVDLCLVEGAGGVLVRLGADFTLINIAASLMAPAVVVTAAGLGTLNHTELTVQALQAGGVSCPGLIIGSLPRVPDLASQCNYADLPRVTGVPLAGAIPEGAGSWPPAQFRRAATGWIAAGILPFCK